MSIEGRVVVITGASSGFGAATARQCRRAGGRVVLAARSADRLDRLAAELGADRALAVPTDVSNEAQVGRLLQATIDRWEHADVLVCNAGFGVLDPVHSAPLADLQEMIDVNVYGTVRCIQAFLPHMIARRSGQLVIVASQAGFIATEQMAFYSASKAALVAIGRALMLELCGTGVRCTMIYPGIAPTGFQARADARKYARITRLTRCTTEQVANAIVRAIARRSDGEVFVPGYARPLIALAGAFPALTRRVLRLVG